MSFYINESLNMVHVTYMLYIHYCLKKHSGIVFVCLFFCPVTNTNALQRCYK